MLDTTIALIVSLCLLLGFFWACAAVLYVGERGVHWFRELGGPRVEKRPGEPGSLIRKVTK